MPFTIRYHFPSALVGTVLTVALISPSLGGVAFRAALVAPFVWAGVLDAETATRMALWSAWGSYS